MAILTAPSSSCFWPLTKLISLLFLAVSSISLRIVCHHLVVIITSWPTRFIHSKQTKTTSGFHLMKNGYTLLNQQGTKRQYSAKPPSDHSHRPNLKHRAVFLATLWVLPCGANGPLELVTSVPLSWQKLKPPDPLVGEPNESPWFLKGYHKACMVGLHSSLLAIQ